MTLLSLETSRAIHALIGDYESEKWWIQKYNGRKSWKTVRAVIPQRNTLPESKICPAPTFAELIREAVPKIGKEKGWVPYHAAVLSTAGRDEWHPTIIWVESVVRHMAYLYVSAPTEPKGMKAVEEYLMKLLK